ncbi:NnrT protein [Hoeflea olei]|uniref:NnrT protein n=1 Tax=Hoeflea olei TaxID=1480615 RepID=A0A1C1YSA1_9HYPH|nr:NnrT protein [Hoeflea olei]OCW56326.1 NnrT protein [Hoeflea olei]
MSRRGWPAGRIAFALYPFGAGAMAVNAFFASLIGSWIGLPVLSTPAALLTGAVIAVPATYAFARHIRALMTEADRAADRALPETR